jgi:tRNA(Ile)-lysidine synthase
MALADSVRRTIRRFDLLSGGNRLIVALSGGGDSVALLHVLRDLEAAGDLVVAGAAHFNHQLRASADEDERFCRDLCVNLSIPLEVGRGDVRAAAAELKRSVEDAGRQLRYAFLHEAAARLNADAIAVGHTRDDQAETFLLRIVRGAGTRGLGAIRPKAGLVIRPLIDESRAELRSFAAERGMDFREDESNAELAIPRNRVRHELLPYLAREFSPNIAEVLAREAELAREDNDRLEIEAIEIASSVVLTLTPQTMDGRLGSAADLPSSAAPRAGALNVVEVDVTGLTELHPAVASRVARIALGLLRNGGFIGFDQVQRFLDFARSGKPGSAMSLPGQQAVHMGERVRLQPEPRRDRHSAGGIDPDGEAGTCSSLRKVEERTSFQILLSIPGEVVLPVQRWAVSADWASTAESDGQGSLEALVEGLSGPLTVRSRRPGDRFRPPGLGGRAKKLQDFFVDRKVPRADRDRVPLVVDRDDRIVWIVGHAVAEGFRATTPSPGVILLKARQLGGEV